jgi:hypothetical protein
MDGVRALVTYGAAAVPRSPVTPEPHGKTGPPRPSGTCIHGDTSISALACRTLLSNDLRQDGWGTISQIHVASTRPGMSGDGPGSLALSIRPGHDPRLCSRVERAVPTAFPEPGAGSPVGPAARTRLQQREARSDRD